MLAQGHHVVPAARWAQGNSTWYLHQECSRKLHVVLAPGMLKETPRGTCTRWAQGNSTWYLHKVCSRTPRGTCNQVSSRTPRGTCNQVSSRTPRGTYNQVSSRTPRGTCTKWAQGHHVVPAPSELKETPRGTCTICSRTPRGHWQQYINLFTIQNIINLLLFIQYIDGEYILMENINSCPVLITNILHILPTK